MAKYKNDMDLEEKLANGKIFIITNGLMTDSKEKHLIKC
jgi:hypothetical protein